MDIGETVPVQLWLILLSLAGHYLVLGTYTARRVYRYMSEKHWDEFAILIFTCLFFIAWPVALPMMQIHAVISSD